MDQIHFNKVAILIISVLHSVVSNANSLAKVYAPTETSHITKSQSLDLSLSIREEFSRNISENNYHKDYADTSIENSHITDGATQNVSVVAFENDTIHICCPFIISDDSFPEVFRFKLKPDGNNEFKWSVFNLTAVYVDNVLFFTSPQTEPSSRACYILTISSDSQYDDTFRHQIYTKCIGAATIKFSNLKDIAIFITSISQKRPDVCGASTSNRAGKHISGDVDAILTFLTGSSIILITFTIVVYKVLPSLQNIHGKCILNHLICMAMFYLCQFMETLVNPEEVILTSYERKVSVCWALGFITYLTSLWANFWLSAVNLDIFQTFTAKTHETTQDAEKRYIKLQIVAWCLPICLALGVLSLDFSLDEKSIFSPNIGCKRCYFAVADGYEVVIYYYSIVAILLCYNFVTFAAANYVLCSVQSITNIVRRKKEPKLSLFIGRVFLFFKLFCVTGTTWTINVGFWFFEYHLLEPEDRHIAFRILECFNVSHGFCYFIVFICKPSIFKQLNALFSGKRNNSSNNNSESWKSRSTSTSQASTRRLKNVPGRNHNEAKNV